MIARKMYPLLVGIALLSVLLPGNFLSADPHGGGGQVTTGVVYKQGLVLDGENGEEAPMFAEYDPETGDVISLLTDFDATDKTIWIGNGEDYRASAKSYNDFIDNLIEGEYDKLQVLTLKEFRELTYPDGFEKGTPFGSSRSLLVYKPKELDETIQFDAEKDLIVYESRYELEELKGNANIEAKSLLFDEDGTILHKTLNNLGFRVAYIKPDGEIKADERSAIYEPGDELLAPVTNAWVSNGLSINGKFPTDSKGRYESYFYIPPCPGFTHHYSIPMFAAVPYRSFNPQREGSLNHYMFSSISGYTCIGAPFYSPSPSIANALDYINAVEIYALNQPLPTQAHFQVDVTLISGSFTLSNETNGPAIPVADETLYTIESQAKNEYELPEEPDFNYDDEIDHVSKLGSIDPPEGTDVPHYGVWFNIGDDATLDDLDRPVDDENEVIEPDLVRVATRELSFDDIGLLEQVSKEDLLDTDLYVFRASTGELVVEKVPFSQDEGNAVNGVDENTHTGFFELAIPGRDANNSFGNIYQFQGDYEDWQASLDVTETLRGDVDSLRVGEPIQVVAINRVTGYIGSARTSIQSATASTVGIELRDLVLYPPNLHVQVTREYKVEFGLTKGDERRYRVGSEGAALKSDQFVSIHTEWLDHEGGQLPSELPGYTARLSTLVDDDMLNANVDHFAMEPGKHIEVLKFNSGNPSGGAAHQYLHVSAKPIDETADFTAADSGPLKHRPEKYVPVRVAVYDEKASRELKNAQLELEEEKTRQDSRVYQWPFRPEMMYSVYELDVRKITRTPGSENDQAGEPIDITKDDKPVIAATDEEFSVTQDLIGSQYDPLDFFGPESNVVYSLEGYQNLVSAETDRKYTFEELAHLGQLGPEDFLTLNLLNNQDAGNILWEWAFQFLYIDTTDDMEFNERAEEGYYVFADNPVVNLAAGVIGPRYDKEGKRRTIGLRWSVEGDGKLESKRTIKNGRSAYTNVLTMKKTTGSSATVFVELEDDSNTKTQFTEVFVLPGKVASIQINQSGTVGLNQTSGMLVEASVKDAHGNAVLDGTPVGFGAVGFGEFSESLDHTVNGIASALLVGGSKSGSGGIYEVDAGGVVEERNFSVSSPGVSVNGIPDTAQVNQESTIIVKVTGPTGKPASEIFVSVTTTAGVLNYVNGQHLTDANGRLSLEWFSGHQAFDEAVISIRIGSEQLFYKVVPGSPAAGDSNTISIGETVVGISNRDVLLIGDRPAAGTVPYQGLVQTGDDTLDFDIAHTLNLTRETLLTGEQNTINLSLGSLDKPNRSPVVLLDGESFRSTDKLDETGLREIRSVRVNRVADHPDGYGYSLGFSKSADESEPGSKIDIELVANIESLIAHVSVFPEEENGKIMQLGSGMSLILESDRTISFTAMLDGTVEPSVVSVSSEPISLNQWHDVTIETGESQLNLWIDGTLYQTDITDGQQQVSDIDKIVLGGGFAGKLAGISIYNKNSSPLALFDNDAETLSLELSTGETTPVNIVSQNALEHNEILGRLQGQRVSLKIGDSVSEIDIITAREYSRVSSLLRDTIDPELAWTWFKTNYRSRTTQSQQSLFEDVMGNRLDRSTDGFQEIDSMIALLGLLKLMPEASALDGALSEVQAFYSESSDQYLLAAASQHLYRHIEPFIRGAEVDIDAITVPLNVLSEMLKTSPSAGWRLAQTIQTEADFSAWLSLFSLPANGWIGYKPLVPSLGLSCDDPVPEYTDANTGETIPLFGCAISGQIAASVVNTLVEDYENAGVPITHIPSGIKQMLASLPMANIFVRKNLFPSLAEPDSDGASLYFIDDANAAAPLVARGLLNVVLRPVSSGKKALKRTPLGLVMNLLEGYVTGSNSRIHPVLMSVAMYYLGTRIFTKDCAGDAKCKSLHKVPNIETTYLSLLAKAMAQPTGLINFPEISKSGEISCLVGFDGHGANFEIWTIALFNLLSEQLDLNEYTIKEIQYENEQGIRRFTKDTPKPDEWDRLDDKQSTLVKADVYKRFADIVVWGENGDDGPGKLVELKSYPAKGAKPSKRSSKYSKTYKKYLVPKTGLTNSSPLWNAAKNTRLSTKLNGELREDPKELRTRTIMHRQILLDAMLSRKQLPINIEEGNPDPVQLAADFVWYFQDWEPKEIEEGGAGKGKGKGKGKEDDQGGFDEAVGISVVDVVVKGKNKTDPEITGMDHFAQRLSKLGGKEKLGRELVVFNLGLDDKALGFTHEKSVLYDEDIRHGDKGLIKNRIEELSLWGVISDDTEAKKILIEDGFGIDTEGDIGNYILDGSFDKLDDLLAHMEELKEDIGINTAKEKLDNYESWIEKKWENAKKKYTPERVIEIRDSLVKKKDELVKDLEELYDEGQEKLESLVSERLGVEFQCL